MINLTWKVFNKHIGSLTKKLFIKNYLVLKYILGLINLRPSIDTWKLFCSNKYEIESILWKIFHGVTCILIWVST